MKKLTLTTAHRIRKSLENMVNSSSFTDSIKTNISLSIYEDDITNVEKIQERIILAESEAIKEFTRLEKITNILINLRESIAKTNKEINISELLDKESAIKIKIKMTSFISKQNKDDVLPATIISNKLKSLSNVESHSYFDNQKVTTGVIGEETINNMNKALLKLKKSHRVILDEISSLNSSNFVTISKEDYDFIEDLGIM